MVQRLDARPLTPLAQMPPRLMGLSGFPSSSTTRPSFTWASTAQLAMHARHDVLTMVVWPLFRRDGGIDRNEVARSAHAQCRNGAQRRH